MQLVQITMKAHDENALGRFWAQALGWEVDSEAPGVINLVPQGFDWPDPSAVCIDLVKSDEPKVGKNRVHLDLAHQPGLVDRLIGLGATRAHVGQQPDVAWTVLADPEGNEFCVLEPRELYLDTGPIAAVAVDCADPRAMAAFWGAAIGWTVHDVKDTYASLRSPKGVGPYLEFLRTPDTKTGWNRVHLDTRPDAGEDRAAEIDRLRALGATDVDLGDAVHWTVMRDPEGNEFCVLTRQ